MKTEKRDLFEVSDGNIAVLKNIPLMMEHPDYRKKLRELTFKYLQEVGTKGRW